MKDLCRREDEDPAKGRERLCVLTIPHPSRVCQGFSPIRASGPGEKPYSHDVRAPAKAGNTFGDCRKKDNITRIPLQSAGDLCIIPYEHGPVRRERDASSFQESRRPVRGGKGGAPLPLPEGADENPRGRPLTASRAVCRRQASRVATRVHRPGRRGGVSFLS